jgi:hypothetical protein
MSSPSVPSGGPTIAYLPIPYPRELGVVIWTPAIDEIRMRLCGLLALSKACTILNQQSGTSSPFESQGAFPPEKI